MALVPYSDSESDGDNHAPSPKASAAARPETASPPASSALSTNNANNTLKRKRGIEAEPSADLPPLPAMFHDLYSTNARSSTRDDPSLHGGRKRAVPHTEGMWPSHIYLEWYPSHTEATNLQSLIDAVQSAYTHLQKTTPKLPACPDVTSLLRSDLGAPLPLHISLSRTLQIPTDDRDVFQETVTRCLRKAAVAPFCIAFSGLRWVSNFEGNRWFLVLGIAKPEGDELNRLLEACNDAAEKTGHPCLYTGKETKNVKRETVSTRGRKKKSNMSNTAAANSTNTPMNQTLEKLDKTEMFHISIASTLEEPPSEYNKLLETWEMDANVKTPRNPFQVVKVKIGNVIHNIELGSKKPREESGFSIIG